MVDGAAERASNALSLAPFLPAEPLVALEPSSNIDSRLIPGRQRNKKRKRGDKSSEQDFRPVCSLCGCLAAPDRGKEVVQ